MARVYTVREITRGGKPTGKFRVISHNDESEDGLVISMCEHDHDTKDEAQACHVVIQKLAPIFRPVVVEKPVRSFPPMEEQKNWVNEPEVTKARIADLETSLRSVIDLAVRLRDDDADNSFDDFIVREARKVLKGGA
jgi:hypothetical protein